MSAATASALAALHASIADEKARHAYWTAFAKFMRFELEKPDFDRVAVAALGPHVAQHNAVIMALLKAIPGVMNAFIIMVIFLIGISSYD